MTTNQNLTAQLPSMKLASRFKRHLGFTLIEVLASVTIIGIIVFLAIPNIMSVRSDTEENMAIARAESVNMAVSSFIQANGLQAARVKWEAVSGDANVQQKRYELISPYMAYPPTQITDLMPSGYFLALQDELGDSAKAPIRIGSATGSPLAY